MKNITFGVKSKINYCKTLLPHLVEKFKRISQKEILGGSVPAEVFEGFVRIPSGIRNGLAKGIPGEVLK